MALRSSVPAEGVSLSMALGRTVPVEHARPVGSGAESLLPDLSSHDPETTIVPPDAFATRRTGMHLDLRAARESSKDVYALEELLGEGGMGAVWLSTQQCLGRKVAVKTLRDTCRDEHSALALLREARITGSLEHPNVVPVYDVAFDGDGMPRVMLKRIQGVEWLALMHDEARVESRFGEALLEWNLKVFLQVCNAVGFAHSRGILHRDLKPANVMIGEFGQVYLLDWGLAVGLRDDVDLWIPRATEVRHPAGTPTYMAPEMARDSEVPLSERTDVYLLGALIYQIVAGRPPHRGNTLDEVLASAAQPVTVPENCPPELRSLLARALAVDPGERYPTVEALRRDVSAAVSHRDAARVAVEADKQLVALERLVAEGAEASAVRRQYSVCRFGFRASLVAWPENADASRGLERSVEVMIDYELAQGQIDAAVAVASEIENLPAPLRERLQAAAATAEAERDEARRLANLGRHQDKRVGQGARMLIATVLGLIWTVAPLAQVLLDAEEDTYTMLIARSGAFVVLLATMGYWARATMMQTAINRHLLAGMGLALVSQIFLTVGGVFLGLRPDQVLILGLFSWCCFTTMFALTTEPRLYPTAVAHLVAFLVASLLPHATLYAISAAKFVLTINALAVWRPVDPEIAPG